MPSGQPDPPPDRFATEEIATWNDELAAVGERVAQECQNRGLNLEDFITMAPAATSGKPVKPSRKGKMQIHLWLDPLLVRRARMAAPMLDKSVKEVVTEAFLDYLTKHKVPEV